MAGKVNSNPVQQQINEETADLYAITYLEDYLDCVENMPDEIQRNVSRMNELDIDYSAMFRDLDSKMEELCEMLGGKNGPPDKEKMKEITALLMQGQFIGDKQLQLSQNIQETVENKARTLDLDKKNYCETEREGNRGLVGGAGSEPAKKSTSEREMKRARRARHEVYVPSILGPSTLAVTTFPDGAPESGGRAPYAHNHHNQPSQSDKSGAPGATASSSHAYEGKGASSHHGEAQETPTGGGGGGGRARGGAGGGGGGAAGGGGRGGGGGGAAAAAAAAAATRDNNDETPTSTAHSSRGTERTAAVAAAAAAAAASSSVTPKKAGTKGAANEKKQKKRKAKQPRAHDVSPPDPVDPDEPTYCLCDQISYGEMIGCDNDLCPIEWFHFSCVSLAHKPKGKWYCPKCRGDKSTVMKPKAVFLKELEKYNREKEEKA